jgi:glutaconate CoA-transferase subunit A
MTSPWQGTVGELVAGVGDGARVGVGGFHFTRVPVAQLRALRDRRDLTYVAWGGGLALELLLDAGAVARAELTFSSLEVFGLAPRFRRAVEEGTLELQEWTALGMMTALQARSRRLDAGVMQRLRGTDLGSDWSRPLDAGQATVDALALDAFLLHAGRADDAGNVELRGARGFDLSGLFAADRVLVTVEERVPVGALDGRGAFVVPRTFVSGVAIAEHGAYPTSCLPHYPADLRRLRRIAATPPDEPLDDALLVPDAASAARLRAIAEAPPRALLEAIEREGATAAGGDGAAARADDAVRAGDEAAAPRDGAARRDGAAGAAGDAAAGGRDVAPAASRDEVMVCALARTVRPGDVVSVGSASPLPTVAYLLAKLLWAPDVVMLSFNGGLVDVGLRPMTLTYAELLDFHSAAAHAGGDETYHWYYQQGRVTHEVVGAAQVDRSGATNNLHVRRPDGRLIRLPGQGGMADVANLHASFLLYLPRQSRRNTVARVDARSAARVVPGRTALLTDLGLFELDPAAGGLVLTRLHPGVELEEVRERTGWPLLVSDDLQCTPAPTHEELEALRKRVDPLGIRRLDFVPAAERGALIDELLDREDRVLDAVHAGAAA